MTISRIEQFEQLLAMDPQDPLLYFGLGEAYLEAKRYEEAIGTLQKLLEIQPEYSAAYRHLGQALEKSGQLEAAKEVYKRGIPIAEKRGDLQTKKEMEVFLRRLESQK